MDADSSFSDRLGARIHDLRTRSGLSQEDLAAAAREHGADDSFSGKVVGFLENGRRQAGRRTRLINLDEILPLASALEVTPLELLGDAGQLFVGDSGTVKVECPRCASEAGGLEKATRADLARLGELKELETTLVETAFRLAKAIDDGEDPKALPALTKELRATVQELGAGRRRAEKPPEEEDPFGDLDDPD
jgi:transcriptional regulator with XRE-family HTH domain